MNRFFFAFQVKARWPELPHSGRKLHVGERHITLAYLGKIDLELLLPKMAEFPLPDFPLAPYGVLDKHLELPRRRPRVVAWHAQFGTDEKELQIYQTQVTDWLATVGFPAVNEHPHWLPHVTLCRAPYDAKEWERAFVATPFVADEIHLYESVGHLRYTSRWNYRMIRSSVNGVDC